MKLVMIKKIKKQETPVTTCKIVSEETNYEIRAIKNILTKYKSDFEEFGILHSQDAKTNKRGRPEKTYFLNEHQLTLLITFLGNNEVVRKFKKKIVKEFYNMKNFIEEKQTDGWKNTRGITKTTGKDYNATLCEFDEYAKEQGSKNPKRLANFNNIVNKELGIKSKEKDNLDHIQMAKQILYQNKIKNHINKAMKSNRNYKPIHAECKEILKKISEALE